MNEDPTRKLPTFEERMIAAIAEMHAEMRERFAAMDARLSAVEELRGTRPLWDNILLRLTNIKQHAQQQTGLLNEIVRDLFATRSRLGALEDKMRERQPAA